MKKEIMLASAVVFTAGMFFITGCKKDDTTPPVITLIGDNSVKSILNATYTDQGATAKDDKDDDLTASITVTNSVDKDLVGTYTIKYSVSDAAGNEATETRTVIVYNEAEAVWAGTYTGQETDANGPYVYGTIGGNTTVSVTTSTKINNQITMNRLGDFTNNTVYMNIIGTTITIPSQTHSNVGVGTKSCDIHDRKTDGTGAKTATGFTLKYNDEKVAPCSGTRTGVDAVFVKQ